MNKLIYAKSPDYASAHAVLFGVDTQCAGTAPTYTSKSDHEQFSPDCIRSVDNTLYSLPENLKSGIHLWDQGNLNLPQHNLDNEIEAVAHQFKNLLHDKKIPICLGGDHIIKYAALKALDEVIPGDYGVIYLDAHPDCEPKEKVNYSSILHHGFLLPALKPKQVMLMGVRQFTDNEASALQSYLPEMGVVMGSAFASANLDLLVDKICKKFSGLQYLYCSIDLDGLDPASAPAVESPYPGGPNVNQVLYLIHALSKHFKFIGMDISEFIPKLDINHTTALSAARIMKEFYSVL